MSDLILPATAKKPEPTKPEKVAESPEEMSPSEVASKIPEAVREQADAISAEIQDLAGKEMGLEALLNSTGFQTVFERYMSAILPKLTHDLVKRDRLQLNALLKHVEQDRDVAMKMKKETLNWPSYSIGLEDARSILAQTPPPAVQITAKPKDESPTANPPIKDSSES